jgi:hypothetical protein
MYSRQIGPPEGADVVIILNDHAIFKLIHGKQTEKQKNRQTDKQTNRQTDKQTNRKTEKNRS